MPRYVVVTGGVLSGLGKGIVSASIAKILQARGFSVTTIKCDGYLNYDAGTLRPTEHGEVWVTYDGGEIDQDFGHYERFLSIRLPKKNNITSGQIYWQVVKNEREGKYLGKTVQLIPHVTDEIKRRIRDAAKGYDIAVVEIGGTVGDYENAMFIEAVRQLRQEGEKTVYVHVSYVPIPSHIGEPKTKPTQLSVKTLLSMGLQPDIIVARSKYPLDGVRKRKIAMFCNVDERDVISDPDLEIIYELPLIFEEQGLGNRILEKFGLQQKRCDLAELREFVEKIKSLDREVKIGIVGKYFETGEFQLGDSYVSVIESVKHAAWHLGLKPRIVFISSHLIERRRDFSEMEGVEGIIVPGGFGASGVEGKIEAIRYARENNIPFLGLCFGFQLAVVEFARNVCGMEGAHSAEIDRHAKHPVIDLLPWQRELMEKNQYGATMRLGEHKIMVKPNTLLHKLYAEYGGSRMKREGESDFIFERFRHRYEVNPRYAEKIESNGFIFSATADAIMQAGEIRGHKFFLGTQFHPEFKSYLLDPSPVFLGFVKACAEK